VDFHQTSLITCDLHALGFIKSLLQAYLCQQSPPDLVKPTPSNWIDEL